MNTSQNLTDLEKELFRAADLLPEPVKPLPVSPVMAQRRRQDSRREAQDGRPIIRRLSLLWHTRTWRAAAIALLALCLGTTTALAASPQLREAVIRFFTSGTVEKPPVNQLDPYGTTADPSPAESTDSAGESISDNEIPAIQTVGSLTLTQSVTLDSHFTAMYASSTDFLELIRTPSGKALFPPYLRAVLPFTTAWKMEFWKKSGRKATV